MEESLKDIYEQINIFKSCYWELVGASRYVLNFSYNTRMSGNDTKNEVRAKSLNNKIKKINEYILCLKKGIDDL